MPVRLRSSIKVPLKDHVMDTDKEILRKECVRVVVGPDMKGRKRKAFMEINRNRSEKRLVHALPPPPTNNSLTPDPMTTSLLSRIEHDMNAPKLASHAVVKLDNLFARIEFNSFNQRVHHHTLGNTDNKHTRTYCDPLDKYETSIFQTWNAQEELCRSNPVYLSDVQQNAISGSDRRIVVDWLIEVCEEYRLSSHTLYLSVHFLDRVLSVRQIHRSSLQLVAVVALFIASKYEEKNPPTLSDFVKITADNFSSTSMREIECVILNTLRFRLTCPTPFAFISRFAYRLELEPTYAALSLFMCEIFLHDELYLRYLPSQVALASILVSLHIHEVDAIVNNPAFYDIVRTFHQSYTIFDVFACAEDVHRCFLSAKKDLDKLDAVHLKYASRRFGSISQAQFALGRAIQIDGLTVSLSFYLSSLLDLTRMIEYNEQARENTNKI